MSEDPRALLQRLLQIGIAAADPAFAVPRHLPEPPAGRTYVVAAGKAAASMAKAVEDAWPAGAPLSGIALTRDGHGLPCRRIEVLEAAHPVPDERGPAAARRILAEAEALGPNDLLLALISGGGSALLALPAEGVSFEEKRSVNRALLASGAPIGAMNAIRKRMSAIKGGKLAIAAYPATVVTLAISDVPGDDPGTIASGPTVPMEREDVAGLVARYGVELPASVEERIKGDAEGNANHPVFADACFTMVSKPATMIAAVAKAAGDAGLTVMDLGADVEGEASEVGRQHAALALRASPGTLILSGGETTVTVRAGDACGRGGRNCEYLLALALGLNGAANVTALAADTDGIDGSEDNAGAFIDATTLDRAGSSGVDPATMLVGHDSYTLFERLGDLILTGPTRTNVNDLRMILVS
ncbi:glycerate kinase [Rhizobiaceae bacterium]|nr:glycerate kinase [Rhizobiaceae bacterium]